MAVVGSSPGGDLATLRSRLTAFYKSAGDCTQTQFCTEGGYHVKYPALDGCAKTCALSANFSSTLCADGSWQDVNYTLSSHSSVWGSIWPPVAHLERMGAMARAVNCDACGASGTQPKLSQLQAALSFWLAMKRPCFEGKNPNTPGHITAAPGCIEGGWWWGCIGEPQWLAMITFLLQAKEPTAVPAAQLKTIGQVLDLGAPRGDGENLLWTQQVTINNGALFKNSSKVKVRATLKLLLLLVLLPLTLLPQSAFENMWTTVVFSDPGDGIEVDGSFHFHGKILYSGGYGGDEALQLSESVNWTAGTAWAPPTAALKVFATYMLDGQRWMVRSSKDAGGVQRTWYDSSVKGREVHTYKDPCR